MKNLLDTITHDFTDFAFTPGDTFCWLPKEQTISFMPTALTKPQGTWTLLHELAHGVLNHTSYDSDFELIQLEAQAWQTAKRLARQYDVAIDEDYIQDCLDTYRDWLHMRSTCPNCGSVSLQINSKHYKCFNCAQVWSVTSSRFCRPYRRSVNKKTSPAHTEQAMFM